MPCCEPGQAASTPIFVGARQLPSVRPVILERFKLDGKVAIVTGASAGLGVSFAEALAQAGADVALGARREERLRDTAGLVKAAGRRALTVQTDVSKPEDCQALV